jgi:hypothetical protein
MIATLYAYTEPAAAANDVKMDCCKHSDQGGTSDNYVLFAGWYGEWQGWKKCSTDQFACGIQVSWIRFQVSVVLHMMTHTRGDPRKTDELFDFSCE